MPEQDFYIPQNQSKIGIILIFSTTLYHLVRNFWVLGVYFLVQDIQPIFLFIAGIGLTTILILALIYSIFYYLKFKFFIDEKKEAFVLQKGVFSSDVVRVPFSKIQQVNFKRNILQNILGVYSVVIDTAGSQGKEVEIKALSKEKADVLAKMLLARSYTETNVEAGTSLEEDAGDRVETLEWDYKLKIGTLLKIGLTSNYLRGLAILLAFYFNFKSQFNASELDYSTELPVQIPEFALSEFATTLFLFLALLLIGLLITVGETFIKYYNLHLKKSISGLQVQMGLKNNTRVNVKAERLQLLQEVTNPLQKRLDLHKLKISLASSRDVLSKNQIKIPGLPKDVVEKVKNYFYGKTEIIEKYKILPQKVVLTRNILRWIFPLVIGLIVLELSAFSVPMAWLSGFIFIYVLILIIYQYFFFKTIQLSVSEDFLVKQYGLWNRKKQIIEMYKLQAVTVSRSFWCRKNLVNLTFHSAGGDISYTLLNKAEVVPLMNYLLYKIESTSKSWM